MGKLFLPEQSVSGIVFIYYSKFMEERIVLLTKSPVIAILKKRLYSK